MSNSFLHAVSPVDGRYSNTGGILSPYFSEKALIQYRLRVEIEYFIDLAGLPLKALKGVSPEMLNELRGLYNTFTDADALRVKEIEKTTNHDIKALEYFIKEAFEKKGLEDYKEFIHFALTSQDVNNTALPLSIKEAQTNVVWPMFESVIALLNKLALQWKAQPMLAFTHGQPASPTTMGKEILVFVERLRVQFEQVKNVPISAKFGGATGNFNAHKVAYPEVNWLEFADTFVNNTLGLCRSKVTTQIEHYDNLASLCQAYMRFNTILIDLCRDIWAYISMNYFRLAIKEGEVGSSAMPHKVNPIDFENAEGNLGISNAIFAHLAEKLPISRLQRDLTDSTVSRNVGVPFAHMLIAIKSLLRGLEKLSLNEEHINEQLGDNWSVLAEAIQTVLRKECYPKPYEKLKELTRTHQKVTRDSLHLFIDSLDIDDKTKEELKLLTPFNYTGYTDEMFGI